MTRPLQITIVQGAFLPVPPLLGGAVEKAWYALGRELAHGGHQVTHVSRAFPGLPSSSRDDDGVHHCRVPGFDTPSSLWRLKALDLAYSLRVRRALPPGDVLVTNTFWLPVVERRRSRGRLYVHVARYPRGQLRFYPRRAVFQTVSGPVRAAILREVPAGADRIRVIPYPLAPEYLVPYRPARPVILYAGRIHPEKGLHLLIDAFARLRAGGLRDWSLRIAGPWEIRHGGGGAVYREALAAAAAQAGPAVEFIDPVFDDARLAAIYADASIFAYPSLAERGETFGLAVLEAMAAGAAPVVSALACFRDFVRPDGNGEVFDHRCADPAGDLARVLGGLATEAARRERLRKGAWAAARDFALPKIAGRLTRDFLALVDSTHNNEHPTYAHA